LILEKLCLSCSSYKPLDEFYQDNTHKDGHASSCKECVKSKRRKFYHANRERLLVAHKKWRKQWVKNLKEEVLSYYGEGKPVCVRCGFNDIRALTIDHIRGGGMEHRKKIGIWGGIYFYSWLKRRGFPTGFQTLCMNCQLIKRFEEAEW